MQSVTQQEGLRLKRFSEEIGRIAQSLLTLPEGLAPALDHRADSDEPVTANEIRAIIAKRRLRNRFFPAHMFADPAWDMLLDLGAARLERARVSVSSLCIAAAVPPSTAIRWIKGMEAEGMIQRQCDPFDARRIFLELTDETAENMERCIRAMR